MHFPGSQNPNVHAGPTHPGGKRSLRRLSAYVGLSLAAFVLAVTGLVFACGGALLDGYGKRKAERAFARAHPGSVLRLGELSYSVRANRLVAQSVSLTATNSTLHVARLSLSGVGWLRWLWGSATGAGGLATAGLEATQLELDFPQAHYGLRCARVRASVPAADLLADGIELLTLVGDEAFFAAHAFRTTRFHVVVPECRVSGLAYAELLAGTAYRAKSVHFSQPAFEALVNCDKPVAPLADPPLMVHEALAAIPLPFRVDRLSLTHGQLRYAERVVLGAEPGVLTFGAVAISAEGLANRGEASPAIRIQAQGDFMNAAVLKVLMTIPVNSPDLSFHYSGSLGAMDLTRLDPFLEIAEHTRIKSGRAEAVAFEIAVTAGQAHGRVQATYSNLVIAVLDAKTGTEKGLGNRFVSLMANLFKVRNANPPSPSSSPKEGQVNYLRRPQDEFVQYAWRALRTGVLDVISP